MHGRLAANLVRLLDGIAIPQPVDSDTLRFQLFIEGLQAFDHHRPVFIGLAVDNTQGNDLVLVGFDKLPESLDDPVGVGRALVIKPGKGHRVRIGVVNNLLMTAANIFDEITNFRIMERFGRRFDNLFLYLCVLLGSRFITSELRLRFCDDDIFIKSVQQIFRKHTCGNTDFFVKSFPFGCGHLAI